MNEYFSGASIQATRSVKSEPANSLAGHFSTPDPPPNHPLASIRPCLETKQKNHRKVVNKKVNYFWVTQWVRSVLQVTESARFGVVDGTGFEPVTPAV